MTIFRRATAAGLAIMALLTLAACDGGSGSVAGIEGTGDTVASAAATGSVTGFGSVYVNGVRYDTSQADIYVDGARVDESALDTGMVVRIEGERDGDVSRASVVRYRRVLQGPVSAVTALDASRKQFVVAGQTVVVGEDATFAGVAFDDLVAGRVVAVSGLPADGKWLATRVAVVEAEGVALEGPVVSVDASAATVSVGEARIRFDGAVFEGGASGDLAPGVWIAVEGSAAGDGTIDAERIRLTEPMSLPEDGEQVSLEGVITRFDGVGAFRVAGVDVDASSATLEGGDQADLRRGLRVTVNGTRQGDHIVAQSLRLILPSTVRVNGAIQTLDAGTGTLTVLGQTFHTTGVTVFQDRSGIGNRFAGLDNLYVDDRVVVFARQVDGRWVATRVVREDAAGAAVSFEGPAVRIEGSVFRVTGITVDAAGAEGESLLADLRPGTIVRVDGVLTGTRTVAASRIAVEGAPPCIAPVAVACEEDDDADDGDADDADSDDSDSDGNDTDDTDNDDADNNGDDETDSTDTDDNDDDSGEDDEGDSDEDDDNEED